MAKALVQTLKMVAAGMATAFLSRKMRTGVSPAFVQPRNRQLQGDDAWGADDFLFDRDGDGLKEQVVRHSAAATTLSTLLGDLREVLARTADHAPIVIDQPLPASVGETNWSAFDEAVFDVVPMRRDQADLPVLARHEDDFLFEKGEIAGRIVPQSIIAQPELEAGVRF